MVSKHDNFVLEYKKQLFVKEVKKASRNLRVIVPNIKFWSEYGNHFDKGERAHIHLDENLICIAEQELKIMTEDDIIETATHEVSHINHLNHDGEFQKAHDELKIASWHPPSGTIGALPENYKQIKSKKSKIIKRQVLSLR